MTSTVANACGGITVKGQSGTYCLSKAQMNWYSAYAWCKAQGLDLVEVSVCNHYSSCSELKLSDAEKANITNNGGAVGSVWTNTSNSAQLSYYIPLDTGTVKNAYGHRNGIMGMYYALCYGSK